MATYEGSPGIPASTTEEDRPFWDDPFVEPKQQHRFTVRMPVYVPTGDNIDTVQLAERIKAASLNTDNDPNIDALKTHLRGLPDSDSDGKYEKLPEFGNAIESGSYGSRRQISDTIGAAFKFNAHRPADEDMGGFRASTLDAERFEDLRIINLVNEIFPPDQSGIKSLFPPGVDESAKYQLKLRIPEYIAYSFTPPGFSYAPGSIGGDGGGNEIRIEGLGRYGRSAATLTFVTTLRDDLHFSLNLLWTLSSNSSIEGVRKASVRLFDEFLVGQRPDSQKVLTIYEHYARTVVVPDALGQLGNGKGRSIIGDPSESDQNRSAVVGIHKLYDPVIESVSFSEFSYGGTELIKITMGLTFGANYNQSNFYSYQNTDKRYSKLADGITYSMNKGDYARTGNKYRELVYGEDQGTGDNRQPAAGSLRHYLMVTKPNSDSGDKKTLRKLKDEKRIRDQIEDNIIGLPIVGDELRPGADDRGIIRGVYQRGDVSQVNAIFSHAESFQATAKYLAEKRDNTAPDPSVDRPVTNTTQEEIQRTQDIRSERYNQVTNDLPRPPRGTPAGEAPTAPGDSFGPRPDDFDYTAPERDDDDLLFGPPTPTYDEPPTTPVRSGPADLGPRNYGMLPPGYGQGRVVEEIESYDESVIIEDD